MDEYVLCVTCGGVIGDVLPVFQEIQGKRMEAACAAHNMQPAFAQTAPDVAPSMSDVFDAFHIHRECCRARMIACMPFRAVRSGGHAFLGGGLQEHVLPLMHEGAKRLAPVSAKTEDADQAGPSSG